MKRALTVLAASFLCIAAFAQGKVSFQTDSMHLAYWGPSAGILAGTAVNSDNLPPGIFGMAADLYLGTASSQLYLYASAAFGPLAAGPGKWTTTSVTVNANPTTGGPAIPGGTTVFVEIGVRSGEKPPPNIFDAATLQTFQAHGMSTEFTFTLGSGITYPPIWGSGGVWPIGTFNLDQYGLGCRGGIQVDLIPEPSTFALAGLGAAAMLISRRRR